MGRDVPINAQCATKKKSNSDGCYMIVDTSSRGHYEASADFNFSGELRTISRTCREETSVMTCWISENSVSNRDVTYVFDK